MKKIFFAAIVAMLFSGAVSAQNISFGNIAWGQQSGGPGYRAELKNSSSNSITVNLEARLINWGSHQPLGVWVINGRVNQIYTSGTEMYSVTIPANSSIEIDHFVYSREGFSLTVGPQGSGSYAAGVLTILPGTGYYVSYPAPTIWAEYDRKY